MAEFNLGGVARRQRIGQRIAAAFDMRSIRRADAEDPTIYGNDIIVVDAQRSRSIRGEIIGTIPILGIFAPVIR